jgi:hypothetical protein
MARPVSSELFSSLLDTGVLSVLPLSSFLNRFWVLLPGDAWCGSACAQLCVPEQKQCSCGICISAAVNFQLFQLGLHAFLSSIVILKQSGSVDALLMRTHAREQMLVAMLLPMTCMMQHHCRMPSLLRRWAAGSVNTFKYEPDLEESAGSCLANTMGCMTSQEQNIVKSCTTRITQSLSARHRQPPKQTITQSPEWIIQTYTTQPTSALVGPL